jgi:hypothetical protein
MSSTSGRHIMSSIPWSEIPAPARSPGSNVGAVRFITQNTLRICNSYSSPHLTIYLSTLTLRPHPPPQSGNSTTPIRPFTCHPPLPPRAGPLLSHFDKTKISLYINREGRELPCLPRYCQAMKTFYIPSSCSVQATHRLHPVRYPSQPKSSFNSVYH